MEENILDISSQPPKAKAIGGWLYVIGGVILLSAITNFFVFIQYLILLIELDLDELLASDESFFKGLYIIFDFVIVLVTLIWLVYIFYLFIKKRKKFPFTYLGFLGFFILSKVLFILLTDYLNKRNIVFENNNLGNSILYFGIYAMLVGSYFTKSKRVSQTFVK